MIIEEQKQCKYKGRQFGKLQVLVSKLRNVGRIEERLSTSAWQTKQTFHEDGTLIGGLASEGYVARTTCLQTIVSWPDNGHQIMFRLTICMINDHVQMSVHQNITMQQQCSIDY